MLVHATSIRERIHVVQCISTNEGVRSIDKPIIFPSIDSNRVILPHEDALVLTLGVDSFDMRKNLIYPRSSIDLLQMLAYRQMGYFPSALENPSCILSGFNEASTISMGDVFFSSKSTPSP